MSKLQSVFLIVAILIGGAIGKVVVNEYLKNNTFDKQLFKIASETNKNCPFQVDKDTVLENAVSFPNNIFRYNYTMINMTKEEMDIENIKKNFYPILLNKIKNSSDLKAFKDKKVTLQYAYKDKNGKELMMLEFKHSDYKP